VGESPAEVRAKLDVTDTAVGQRATSRTIIQEPKAQARVWKSRKDAGPLLYRKRRRQHPAEFMEDVSVDHRRLADYLAGLEQVQKKHGITMCFFGHAGDGELHVRPYIDLGDPKDRAKMLAIAEDVYTLTWSLGGTISGEHAVGLIGGLCPASMGMSTTGAQKVKEIFDPAPDEPGQDPQRWVNVMFQPARSSCSPERPSELFFRENSWSWN
jgi:FAD/FMN-containing dehydrogenase